jgi:hypothetical protein
VTTSRRHPVDSGDETLPAVIVRDGDAEHLAQTEPGAVRPTTPSRAGAARSPRRCTSTHGGCLASEPELLVADLIVAETVYVLESYSETRARQIAATIRSLLAFVDRNVSFDRAIDQSERSSESSPPIAHHSPVNRPIPARNNAECRVLDRRIVRRGRGQAKGSWLLARSSGESFGEQRAECAPSCQQASRSCRRGSPTTDIGRWAARQRRPVVIISIALTAPSVLVAVHVEPVGTADRGRQAGIVDLVEEGLEGAEDIAQVGRRAEDVAVGVEHIDDGGRERRTDHDLDAGDRGVGRPVRTVSNSVCIAGDGV